MNITILTYGSRGDVQPFLALALGLQKNGHTVKLAAPHRFEEFITSHGIPCVPLAGDPEEISRLINDAGTNPFRVVASMWRYIFSIASDVSHVAFPACGDADLIIHSFLFTVGAREHSIPDISVQTFPVFAPTRAFPNVSMANIPPGWLSYFSHWLATQIFWHGGNIGYGPARRANAGINFPKKLCYDTNGNLIYSGGAPWGVTDLKAAIRYVRYNKSTLPGNTESVFVFGMSGGGAQTAVIGASGDSELYFPYLESIGAAMYDAEGQYISDAVTGAMAWCPITSLDYADAAYEWNMGQYSSTGTRAEGTFTASLSKDLAASYADYINALGIKDENGNVLTLEQSESGIYAAGSYYDYLVATVETSLNHFLADTTFPYTDSGSSFMAGGNFPGGGLPNGGTPPDGGMPGGTPPAGGPSGNNSTSETPVTYQTVQEYIDALNKDGQWVTYDAAANTVTATSLAGFVNSQKKPSKSVGAFDGLERNAGENNVFGNDENDSLHFDLVLADLLKANQEEYAAYSDWDASYIDAYASDIQALDTCVNRSCRTVKPADVAQWEERKVLVVRLYSTCAACSDLCT